MDLQNQNLEPKDTALLQVRPNLLAQSEDDLKTPKARKPYTITKQREKWTDEEHHKFLEALKLYGRAWRQIEEFIGTKTAVQIRSHAQKFFSKVVRGGNDSAETPVQAIEIPPPRPKRKPAHPYPRKFVEPQNNISPPSFESKKRICPQIVTADTENQSPNSVLSAAGTHMLELPVSELPDSCLSSSSSSTGLQSRSLFPVDKEDNSKAISSFPYKENDFPPAIERYASLKVDNSANKGTQLFEKEADLPEATIMLFGQIVSTKDSKRPSADRRDTFNPSGKHLATDSDNKHGNIEESPASNGLNTPLSHGLYYGNWIPWAHEISSAQWMPLPLYTGSPSPCLMSCTQRCAGPSIEEKINEKEPFSNRMKSDSTGEDKDVMYALNPTHLSTIGGDAASPNRTYKRGFVPYRKCSATGSIKYAKMVAEEDDGQRVQLCL